MKTSKSLLQKAKSDPKSEAWFELINLYEPLIAGWIARAGVASNEVEDLTQEVLQSLSQNLSGFEHNGRTGAFRSWLKLMAIHRCRRFWDWKKRQVSVSHAGDIDARIDTLDQLADPSSELSKGWDVEHDRYVIAKVLELVKSDIDPQAYDIFLRYGLGDESAKSVAEDLGINIGQVYKSKFRVLNRIRSEAGDLVSMQDWIPPADHSDPT